jgi:FkbM family methyltransferase
MYLKGLLRMGSLMLHFRNGATLVRCLRAGQPCNELVLWDGTRIAHPADREGLLEGLQEIWLERVYTRGFYRPGDGDVIVDAGANIGLFAIQMARENRRCRVIALEPFAENFTCLQANVSHACPDNVRCYAVALGAQFGSGEMESVGTRSLDHVLRMQRPGAEPRSTTTATLPGVRVVPLANLFELAGAEAIDFLKVDIEGSEHDAFAAATPEIVGRIKRIAMEYHDNIVPGTLALLRRVLAPTHEITVRVSPSGGDGVLLAQLRS